MQQNTLSSEAENTKQRFWLLSCQFYQQPSTAHKLLYLQNNIGLNVNLALYLLLESHLHNDLNNSDLNTKLYIKQLAILQHELKNLSKQSTEKIRQQRTYFKQLSLFDETIKQKIKHALLEAELICEQQEQAFIIDFVFSQVITDTDSSEQSHNQLSHIHSYLQLLMTEHKLTNEQKQVLVNTGNEIEKSAHQFMKGKKNE